MFCSKCGQELAEGVNFCSKCGSQNGIPEKTGGNGKLSKGRIIGIIIMFFGVCSLIAARSMDGWYTNDKIVPFYVIAGILMFVGLIITLTAKNKK